MNISYILLLVCSDLSDMVCTSLGQVGYHSPPELHLTHSCLKISSIGVVWTYDTFKDNFVTKLKFPKYLKKSCRLSSDEQFSFKYFLNTAFVGAIHHQNSKVVLGTTGMNGLKHGFCITDYALFLDLQKFLVMYSILFNITVLLEEM